jgi:hypothetical protein
MNRNAIRLAIAALLPLATSSAWALTPAATQAIPAGNVIYLSGSTAIDPALQAFFDLSPASDTRAPCVANTMDLYKSSTGYIISCTASPAFTGVAGQAIAIAKQTQGGSAIGIINVKRGTTAPGFTDIATLATSAGTPTNTAATGPFSAFNTYPVTSAELAKVPNAGVSDVDPNTFIGIGGVQAADAAALTAVQGIQQPFAVAVSLDLYHALQTAEGLPTGDAFANLPSLTGAQLRALFAGQMLSWADLWVADKANHTIQRQVGDVNSTVHICRRGDTSGSQLATNIYFFNAGCAKGSGIGAVQAPDNGGTVTNGVAWNASTDVDDFVFAGSGTGDVKSCVSSTRSSFDTVNFRIGFVSTDNKPTNTPTDTWRYVAIDEQPGTVYSILQGRYGYLTEDTLNSTAASLALNGGGNHTAIWNYVTGNVGNRVSIAGYNAKFQNAWDLAGTATPGLGDSGVLTLGKGSGNADALTIPMSGPGVVRLLTAGNGPASTVARTYPGSQVNNCNNVFQINPTN